jgi:phosphate transport system protein
VGADDREPAAPVDDPFAGALDDLEPGLGLEAPAGFEHPLHVHRRTFDHELVEIKSLVLEMAVRVQEQLNAAVRGLVMRDAELCLSIIRDDALVNDLQRRVSAAIQGTIATQAPVATDLRFLLTLDHVSYELERMGDHASSVAKQGRKLAPLPPLRPAEDLPELGARVGRLVTGITRALIDVDMVAAREVAVADDDVDALYHRIFDETLELMREDPDAVDRGARIIFAGHYLERIGDRVTNIAEDIVFLASGEVEDLNP